MPHNYQTSFDSKGNLQILSAQTLSYEKIVFAYMDLRTWSGVQKEMEGVILNSFSLVKLKSLVIEFYLKISSCSNSFLKFFYIHYHSFKLVIQNWGFICHCQ